MNRDINGPLIRDHLITRETVTGGLVLAILGTALYEGSQSVGGIHSMPDVLHIVDYASAAVLESARWGIPDKGVSSYLLTAEGRQTTAALVRILLFQFGMYTLATGTGIEWVNKQVSRKTMKIEGRSDISLKHPTILMYGGESSSVAREMSERFPLGNEQLKYGTLLFNEGIPAIIPDGGYINMKNNQGGGDLDDPTKIYYSERPYGQIKLPKKLGYAPFLYRDKCIIVGCGENESDQMAMSDSASGSDFTPAEFLAARATLQSVFGLSDDKIVSIFVGNPNAKMHMFGVQEDTYTALDLSENIHWIDPGVEFMRFVNHHTFSRDTRQDRPLRVGYNTGDSKWAEGFAGVVYQYNAQVANNERTMQIDIDNPDAVVTSWHTVSETMDVSKFVLRTTQDNVMVFPVMTTQESAQQAIGIQQRLTDNFSRRLVIGNLPAIVSDAVIKEVEKATK